MAIEHFLTPEDSLYKILHPFIKDDNKKTSLIMNSLVMLGLIVFNNEFLRKKVDTRGEFAGTKIVKLKINKSTIILTAEKNRLDCFVREGGFLSEWKEINVPEDFCTIIRSAQTKKDMKTALRSLMKLKAFW